MTLLAVDNLCVGYRTRKGFIEAVEGVSFVLKRGRSLGFVGESGSGKTTVGMALMRLLPDNASIRQGSIIFEGQELLAMPAAQLRKIRWKKIAMIFQAAMNALNPIHRVNDQIAEAILTHDPLATKASAMQQVEDLFSLVDLPADRMRDYPHQYSGGMKQRAVIAMALACHPALIIADEPTTALDVIVQDQILSAVKKFQKQMNISLIFISHDIAVVADVCDDIGVMYAGQLVEYGRREEVFETPVHPYTKALLASYLTLDRGAAQPMPLTGVTLNLIDPPSGCRFCDRCPLSDAACNLDAPGYADITPTHKALCFHCK
jgi:peptide/nickel transport system ATP-binding protein